MTRPIEVQEKTFDAEVLEATTPVVVDFWATWCGPCRMIAPIVEKLAEEYAGRVRFVKVDVDAEPKIAERYRVRAIPTLLVLDRGQVRDQIVGAQPESVLRRRIEAVLAERAK